MSIWSSNSGGRSSRILTLSSLNAWLLGPIFLVPLAVVFLVVSFRACVVRELAIDGCLDRGGRWDAATNLCDVEVPQANATP